MSPLKSHLPELLIEVRGINQCPLLNLWVKEILIPGDKEGAQELLHLHSDIHRYRDDEVEEHHEGEEVCKHLKILENKKRKNYNYKVT